MGFAITTVRTYTHMPHCGARGRRTHMQLRNIYVYTNTNTNTDISLFNKRNQALPLAVKLKVDLRPMMSAR